MSWKNNNFILINYSLKGLVLVSIYKYDKDQKKWKTMHIVCTKPKAY